MAKRKNKGEFESEQPSVAEKEVDFENFNYSQYFTENMNEINRLQKKYHKLHSTSSEPAKDQRITPKERLRREIQRAIKNGKNPKDAVNEALRIMKEQDERGELAGKWGRDDVVY